MTPTLFTASRPYLRDYDKGFTLVELLVAMMLGAIMTAMSLAAILSNRRLYQHDLVKTRLNQDLRSAMDLLGTNIREAGENLAQTFPSVEIIDGVGNPDELVLRRSLMDEVLKLCQPISTGSCSSQIYFAYSTTEPGCSYTDQEHNYNTWHDYRVANGGSIKVYIYDPSTQLGEFFDYSGEASTSSTRLIERSGGSWANSYTVGQTGVYIIEEWRFKIGQDPMMLQNSFQVVENAQDSNPMTIIFSATDFQISAHLSDGSEVTSFAPSDDWTNINALEVTITGEESTMGETIRKSYTSRFFPRNILSH